MYYTAAYEYSVKHGCLSYDHRDRVEPNIQQQQVVAMVACSCSVLELAFYKIKCQGQPYPFMNTSLSFEDRVKVHVLSVKWHLKVGGLNTSI